jgi:hypothetical protein
MTTRRLSMLQWLGLLGGGLTWAAQLLIGFGTTQAECSVGKDDPPPQGRLHFFATAALVANLLFLVVIVLSGIASTVGTLCRGG